VCRTSDLAPSFPILTLNHHFVHVKNETTNSYVIFVILFDHTHDVRIARPVEVVINRNQCDTIRNDVTSVSRSA
jgi:hypothetical protein